MDEHLRELFNEVIKSTKLVYLSGYSWAKFGMLPQEVPVDEQFACTEHLDEGFHKMMANMMEIQAFLEGTNN